MLIEPMITRVSSGFSRYIWVDTKIVFKNNHKSNIRPSFCLLFCIEDKKTTGYATDGGEDFVEIKSGEAGGNG